MFKLVDNISFYVRFAISGFATGGSWKIDRITELHSSETRKILIRNMSTYEELFMYREKISQ